MTCRFAHDDGAYVLGALSPAERADYEQHLRDCRDCRHAVGEVAVLPGLLGRLDAATAEESTMDLPAPPPLAPVVAAVAASRRRDRRRRRWAWAAAGVAAVVALIAGLAAGTVLNRPDTPPMTAMTPVAAPGPVTAEVALVDRPGGTEIHLHCAYADTGAAPYLFRLVARGRDGTEEQVASWTAGSGADLTLTSFSHHPRAALAALTLTRRDGTPLLTHQLP